MISGVIPVHNRSDLLKNAVRSVIDQQQDVEVIVVDDESTEDIQKVLRLFDAVPFITIKYFRIPKGGANAARAYGQAQATKPFVQFLDSDDILLPGKWIAQLKHFQKHPGLDVSVSGTFRERGDGHWQSDPQYPKGMITATSFLLDRTAFRIGASLWRRSSLFRVAEWPSDLRSAQDWETHLRAILCGLRFEYCPNSGYLIRGAPTQRITKAPVAAKAVNSILAMHHALSAAKRHGKHVSVSTHLLILALATRRLLVFLRHRSSRSDWSVIGVYRELLRSCFWLLEKECSRWDSA